jgi:hypothetical protein
VVHLKEKCDVHLQTKSHAFDEGIVAWRVISKQILLRVQLSVLDTQRHFSDDEGIVAWRVISKQILPRP